MKIQELKNSSKRSGKFYPVLVDHFGNVVDGEHRLKADKKWNKIKLDHVKTEKDLLIGRLICNNLRRNASRREKTDLLSRLGDIYQQEGIAVGKIAYELAYHTGMSYRWVAKYLPDRLKDSVHASAPKNRKKNNISCLTKKTLTLRNPPKNTLKITSYRNTSFVNFVMKKSLFNILEKKAEELETNVECLVYSAIRLLLNGSANE